MMGKAEREAARAIAESARDKRRKPTQCELALAEAVDGLSDSADALADALELVLPRGMVSISGEIGEAIARDFQEARRRLTAFRGAGTPRVPWRELVEALRYEVHMIRAGSRPNRHAQGCECRTCRLLARIKAEETTP